MNKLNGLTVTCEDVIDDAIVSRGEDFKDMIEGMESSDMIVEQDDATTRFHEYGLSLDWQEIREGELPYLKYLISWGGPSEEIRFYPKTFSMQYGICTLGKIEFVHKDWFDNARRDITHLDWAVWLRDYFQETFPFETLYTN